jgi:hypothetical protein
MQGQRVKIKKAKKLPRVMVRRTVEKWVKVGAAK